VRLYLSAIQSGIIRASFDYSSKYAMERVAFGKKIAHHQGMAFILSDFSIAVSACQLYTYKAAWSLDTKQEDFFRVCADCFAFVSETAEKFTVWGVQILGGHGFVKDHPVEKWMREAKAISLLFGGKHYAEIDAEQII
jgi:alkylation response protein AidB-like acyl-CoA dehydrogenase